MSKQIALGLMVAVGFAAFFIGRATQSKADARADTDRAPSVAERQAHVTREAYDALRQRLTDAESVIKSQERELVRLTAERAEAAVAKVEPEAEPAEPTVNDASAPRFVFEGQEEVLKSIDWKVMGEALNAMPSLLHDLRDAISETPPDRTRLLEVYGQIQQWNGPLLGQAAKMEKADLSGTGTNGIWTHPVFVVNQVYATLAQSKHPLTEAQIPQLQKIGDEYREMEARRVSALTDETFGLEEVIGECALRDALFAAIDESLTPEQQEVLHPKESRGYTTADMFSSAILWNTLVQPVSFTGRAELAANVANMVISHEKVTPAHHDAVRSVVTEWAQALPDAVLAEPRSAATDSRIMRVSHIAACAKHCLKLRKQLAARVDDSAFQSRIRRGKGTLVWFKVG